MIDFQTKLGFVPTLFLDDGHFYIPETGQATAGKRTPPLPGTGQVIYENQFNRAVCDKLEKRAKEIGFNVVQVAPEAGEVSLTTRTDRANKVWAELKKKYPNAPLELLGVFISIHYNAFKGIWDLCKGGVSTFYWYNSPNGKKLATYLQNNLIKGTLQENRGIKADDGLWVLKETDMVANLVEAGFMDVKKEAVLMLNESFQNEVVEEILMGLCQYYAMSYEEPVSDVLYRVYLNDKQVGAYGVKDNAFKKAADYPEGHIKIVASSGEVHLDETRVPAPEDPREELIKQLQNGNALLQGQLDAVMLERDKYKLKVEKVYKFIEEWK